MYRKKLKVYMVKATCTDMLRKGESIDVVIMKAHNNRHMQKKLKHMSPVDPTMFLIYEEII